jgi:hypothetical protein
VPLGRKVDDVVRIRQLPGGEDEHLPGNDFFAFAGGFVLPKVPWEHTLELRGNPAPHEADAVHRIDERFNVRTQDVSSCELHRNCPFRSTTSS